MCRPPPCPCCVDVTSPRVTRSPGCRLPCWPGGRWRPASLTGSTGRSWLRRWMWHSGWRSRDILHLMNPSSCCDFVHCLLFTVSCSLVSLSEDVVAVVSWTMTWVPLVSHHLNVSVISGAGRGRDWRLGIVTTTTSLYAPPSSTTGRTGSSPPGKLEREQPGTVTTLVLCTGTAWQLAQGIRLFITHVTMSHINIVMSTNTGLTYWT